MSSTVLLEEVEAGVKSNLWQPVTARKDPMSAAVRKGDTVRIKRYRSQPSFKNVRKHQHRCYRPCTDQNAVLPLCVGWLETTG